MARKGKLVSHEATVGDVGSAYTEIQELRDEVREIVDNASGSNLENTSRIQALGEAADSLDQNADSEPSVPEGLETIKFSYSTFHAYGKKGDSRAMRRDNATSLMGAAVDALNDYIAETEEENYADLIETAMADRVWLVEALDAMTDEQKAASEKRAEGLRDEAESLRDEIENAKDEFESVEFPGMYG